MRISPENIDLANELRRQIQAKTNLIDDGEGVAIVLLWTFFLDHARVNGLNASDLARDNLEAFIEYAEDNIKLVQQH